MDNLQALVVYLRQNLMEFLHTPKYTDSRADNHFQVIERKLNKYACYWWVLIIHAKSKCKYVLKRNFKLQDYTHGSFSKDRVPEEDMFLYVQRNTSSGNRGMACIAVAIVDASGFLIKPDRFTRPNSLAHLDPIINMDFINITSTHVCNLESEEKGTQLEFYSSMILINWNLAAFVEFRVWKQGKVNLDMLTKNLQSAMHHAFWDLHMEYRLLTAPITQENLSMGMILIIYISLETNFSSYTVGDSNSMTTSISSEKVSKLNLENYYLTAPIKGLKMLCQRHHFAFQLWPFRFSQINQFI